MRYWWLFLTFIAFGCLATVACHKDVAQQTNSQPLDVPTVLKPVPAILNENTLPPVAARRILETTDQGKTWNTVVILEDERPGGFISSTGFHKVTRDPEQRLRVVAAGMGDEGYWGDFVVNEDGRWNSYELLLTPILDAIFLSEKDVVACGLNLRPTNQKSSLKDAGVILRSFDNGRSWQTIYRSKSEETFFFLTRINHHDFYAVSDMGTFLRFTLPQ